MWASIFNSLFECSWVKFELRVCLSALTYSLTHFVLRFVCSFASCLWLSSLPRFLRFSSSRSFFLSLSLICLKLNMSRTLLLSWYWWARLGVLLPVDDEQDAAGCRSWLLPLGCWLLSVFCVLFSVRSLCLCSSIAAILHWPRLRKKNPHRFRCSCCLLINNCTLRNSKLSWTDLNRVELS